MRMKVTVKLFGMMRASQPIYNWDQGADLELPEGSKVADLLCLPGISGFQGVTVIMDGRVLPSDEKLIDGATMTLLQILSGG
jgi:sulfur carrier protein ThiS